MNIRPFLVTTGAPDLVASPTGVNQIPGAALAVPWWQLGVCLLSAGGGEGRKEISSHEVDGRTGCSCPVLHVLKGDLPEYNYNLMDQEGGISTMPASPVTPEDDELLDVVYMVASPIPDYSRAVGTGRPKSTTPKKKKFGGTGDPEEHK